jgi:hypothetical protein
VVRVECGTGRPFIRELVLSVSTGDPPELFALRLSRSSQLVGGIPPGV